MKKPGAAALWAILAFAAAFAAYSPTLRLGFVWDDHRMIEENARIRSWFRGDPFDQGLNYYRPLQTVSNAVDFRLWRLNPAGYHLTNLLFHAGGAAVSALVLSAAGFSAAAAGGAALLLACHPMVVEQLIVVAGRAEVMAYFFTVLTVWLLARPGPASFAGAFISFVLAMLSKETGVIAPLLALLLFYHRGTLRRDWKKTIPLLLLIPLYLTLRRQALGGMPLTELGAGELFLRAAGPAFAPGETRTGRLAGGSLRPGPGRGALLPRTALGQDGGIPCRLVPGQSRAQSPAAPGQRPYAGPLGIWRQPGALHRVFLVVGRVVLPARR